jgi:hypothetical protein
MPTGCTPRTGGCGAWSGPTNDTHPAVATYHKVLVWDIVKAPFVTRYADRVLSPLIGKSLVLYLEKPRSAVAGVAADQAECARGVPGTQGARTPQRGRRMTTRGGSVPSMSTVPEVPGVLSSAEVLATAHAIAALQRPDGMIPWFEGGTATRGTTSRRPWP